MIREYQTQLKVAIQLLPNPTVQKDADKMTLFELYFAEEALHLFDNKFSNMQIDFEEFKRVVTQELRSFVERKMNLICRTHFESRFWSCQCSRQHIIDPEGDPPSVGAISRPIDQTWSSSRVCSTTEHCTCRSPQTAREVPGTLSRRQQT